jgi:hypothetical protein
MFITKIPAVQAMVTLYDHGYPNTNKPFYAKDLGLTSAQILALRSYYLLESTKNPRIEFVETSPGNFIQVYAKQWILTDYGKNVLTKDFPYSAHVLIQLTRTLEDRGFF